MKIAYVSSSIQGETDRVLSGIAELLLSSGVALAGIVRDKSYDSQFKNGCDMQVRILPNGPTIKITQNLGEGSDACRLDPAAIAEAVSHVERQPLEGSDLFILNKFGPEEVSGRGFVSAIANATEADIPVLVGVGASSLEAFQSFAGGFVQPLRADTEAILNWYGKATSSSTH